MRARVAHRRASRRHPSRPSVERLPGVYGTTANRRPPLSGPPLSGPFCKYRRFMTRDYPPHGSESPGVFIPILGFSPHRGVTNRGARVDAAHARARERTTRDTGEDGPRDELSRVESSRVESSRVDARRVSRETTREDEESEERNESRRRFGNSPGGGQRVVTRVRGDDGHPCVREGRPEGFVPPGGGGGARHGARFTANEGGSR